MAKKKIISKKKPVDEALEAKKAEEAKKLAQDEIDAFEADAGAEEDAEVTDIEKEIADQDFDEEIQEERFYVVPLAKNGYMKAPRWKRAKKAMTVLRAFLTKHMKPEGPVYISQEVNERIWENGIRHPPRKIRVRVTKSVDGVVRAYLG